MCSTMMPGMPSNVSHFELKDNDAVVIRQEEAAVAVGRPLDVFRRDAWHAFQNFLLELVVEIVPARAIFRIAHQSCAAMV